MTRRTPTSTRPAAVTARSANADGFASGRSGKLAEAIRPLAAEAYLSGWALTDAPWSPRIEAGLIAAVECAAEFADDPAVLEASLVLGSLTGVWATIYQRRARLQRKHERAILAAWRACTAGLDPADLARWFRRDTYQTAEAATKDPTKRWWRDVAIATALAWLRAVYHTDGFEALVAALADAIRSGMAEGEAGALALAASRQGRTGFRIAAAFQAAYDRLADDHTIEQRAATAVTGIIDATAGDVGRRLAAQAGDGASQDDMAGGVSDVMSGGQAVDRGSDAALWAGIGLGALALYQAIGTPAGGGNAPDIASLLWVTAADGRVCVQCQDNEDNSPYTLTNAPEMPAHPRCRCSWDYTGNVPSSLLDSFTN